jgi:hypothetical protein
MQQTPIWDDAWGERCCCTLPSASSTLPQQSRIGERQWPLSMIIFSCYLSQLGKLEWAWGLDYDHLHVDTRLNILLRECLASRSPFVYLFILLRNSAGGLAQAV